MATSSQFFAPMLTGAINWIPSSITPPTSGSRSLQAHGPGDRWEWLNAYQQSRHYVVLNALGISPLASGSNFDPVSDSSFPRLVPELMGMTINSTMDNVTVPFFNIHSLEWIQSAGELGDDVEMLQDIIVNSSNSMLSFSDRSSVAVQDRNPFATNSDAGRLTLVNDQQWQPAVDYPAPHVQQRSKWVIVATAALAPSCEESLFGHVDKLYLQKYYRSSDDAVSCLAFARMNYTAGTLRCEDCRMALDGVVELTTPSDTSVEASADQLVDLAVTMMPEVLFYMEVANVSLAPTWHNLDGYTRGMLSVAYQTSWNALAMEFATNARVETTSYRTPLGVLTASVTRWRVYAWLAANVLLTVSGIAIAIIQSACTIETGNSPALSALLLDSSAVMGKVTKNGDSREEVRIKLTSRRGYPMLELDHRNEPAGETVYSPVPAAPLNEALSPTPDPEPKDGRNWTNSTVRSLGTERHV